MPLIECPECKKNISSEAKQCPQCGFTLPKPPQDLERARAERKENVLVYLGCLSVVFGLLSIGLFVSAIVGGTISKPTGGITRGWMRAALEKKPEFEYTYSEVPATGGERWGWAKGGVVCGLIAASGVIIHNKVKARKWGRE